MGRAEHLGTGVRNLYHYAPIYLGAEPTITDDDMFRIRLNIAESKRAELAISATDRTTDRTTDSSEKSSEKSTEKSTEKSSEKTWEKIVILIRANSNITIKEMAKEVHTSERNVEKHLSNLQKKGKIRRVDGDNGGYWEIIE